MRARGASLTDIAVIIIAGDDGIMPQTKSHPPRQASRRPDAHCHQQVRPAAAKPERVKQQLQGEG